jgi:hypothetical protein
MAEVRPMIPAPRMRMVGRGEVVVVDMSMGVLVRRMRRAGLVVPMIVQSCCF